MSKFIDGLNNRCWFFRSLRVCVAKNRKVSTRTTSGPETRSHFCLTKEKPIRMTVRIISLFLNEKQYFQHIFPFTINLKIVNIFRPNSKLQSDRTSPGSNPEKSETWPWNTTENVRRFPRDSRSLHLCLDFDHFGLRQPRVVFLPAPAKPAQHVFGTGWPEFGLYQSSNQLLYLWSLTCSMINKLIFFHTGEHDRPILAIRQQRFGTSSSGTSLLQRRTKFTRAWFHLGPCQPTFGSRHDAASSHRTKLIMLLVIFGKLAMTLLL